MQKVLDRDGTSRQDRWDQIKRGRKLSSSIMSANLKGETDRPRAGSKRRGPEQKATEKEEKRTFPVVLKNPSAAASIVVVVVSVFDVAIFSVAGNGQQVPTALLMRSHNAF